MLNLEGERAALAWALFRVAEPDNLGEPDPQRWQSEWMPRAEALLQECEVLGYHLRRER